jgi:hypothetical protein
MNNEDMKKFYEKTKCGDCLSKRIYFIEKRENINIFSIKYCCECGFSSLICSICCYKFKIENIDIYNSHFDRHLKIHDELKVYQCKYCSNSFDNIYQLLFHCEKHFIFNSINIDQELLVINKELEFESTEINSSPFINETSIFDYNNYENEFTKKLENFYKKNGYLEKIKNIEKIFSSFVKAKEKLLNNDNNLIIKKIEIKNILQDKSEYLKTTTLLYLYGNNKSKFKENFSNLIQISCPIEEDELNTKKIEKILNEYQYQSFISSKYFSYCDFFNYLSMLFNNDIFIFSYFFCPNNTNFIQSYDETEEFKEFYIQCENGELPVIIRHSSDEFSKNKFINNEYIDILNKNKFYSNYLLFGIEDCNYDHYNLKKSRFIELINNFHKKSFIIDTCLGNLVIKIFFVLKYSGIEMINSF